MLNIKDFTDQELEEQIANCQTELDEVDYNSGDYNHALAELEVALKEKARRELL
jgi:hypothetical protein